MAENKSTENKAHAPEIERLISGVCEMVEVKEGEAVDKILTEIEGLKEQIYTLTEIVAKLAANYQARDFQSCGHEKRYIRMANDGDKYCLICILEDIADRNRFSYELDKSIGQ